MLKTNPNNQHVIYLKLFFRKEIKKNAHEKSLPVAYDILILLNCKMYQWDKRRGLFELAHVQKKGKFFLNTEQ